MIPQESLAAAKAESARRYARIYSISMGVILLPVLPVIGAFGGPACFAYVLFGVGSVVVVILAVVATIGVCKLARLVKLARPGRTRSWLAGARQRLRNPFSRGRHIRAGSPESQLVANDKGRLVAFLLRSALAQLPEPVRDRWSEEWADHCSCQEGWRLVWWALCLRATAARTGREIRRAHLPLSGN
ncbi:hypothetical protein [Catenuloplanes japonicus]|uniref:hypothetical protein n=1 Tax=Catenuloplanes japonicus TaxID=33876 RepID=UPI0012F7F613|nr:hypothetical protein [Catenuloplanes japonicus]